MKIKFKTISVKNFLSFGASATTLDLNNSPFTLIVGENGSGKSTLIVDALHFALFGKIIRKGIKLAQVVNNINKKNCEVDLDFTIDDTSYRIHRGLAPDFLHLWKDGVQVNERASKVIMQQEIEELLGFDQTTFKNICVLSLNNNKSFMDLTPEETRTVVENLLGIQIYSQMLEKAKVILKENKDKYKILEKDYTMYETMIRETEDTQLLLESAQENFDSNKKVKLGSLLKEQKVLMTEVSDYRNKLSEMGEETPCPTPPEDDEHFVSISKQIDENNSNLSKMEQQKENIENTINETKEKVRFFNETETCPICESVLDDKHKKKELRKYIDAITSLTESSIKLGIGISTLKKETSEMMSNRKALRDLAILTKKAYDDDLLKRQKLVTVIEKKEAEIRNLTVRMHDVESEKLNISADTINKSKLVDFKKKSADVSADLEQTKNEVYYYEFIKELLSDEGIKSQIIANDLPFLNKTINQYLKDFERTYTITFDEQFNLTLGGYAKKGLSYYNLSEGEKKRIDISILLSFVQLARQKNSISCNILAFDELLETSLDEDGKKVLVENLLTNMINRGIIDNIFVISHNKQLILPDSQKIVVYKQGEFSKISLDK